MTPYEEFIKQKRKKTLETGFAVKREKLNPKMEEFQKDIVLESLLRGRGANFSDTGLGKTFMQLEWANHVIQKENKPGLILTPLAVAGQTIEEGEKFGIGVSRVGGSEKIHVANYEQIDNIDLSKYIAIVPDESSILKNFDGKTKQKLVDVFSNFKYKLPCTATPSPNDPMELGNHSEFLNVMSRNEMLAMYFVHDGGETAKWRLKRHGMKAFYEWVLTWASVITKPSDYGYDDGKYILPKLNIIERKIATENRGDSLFNDLAVSATEFNSELRRTLVDRMEMVATDVNSSKEPFIVWVKQDAEADYLMQIIPDAVEVRGSMKLEQKEERLLGFKHGDFRVLVTKPKIAQYGLNYQHCNNLCYPSLDFSFESLYQSVRRSYRFGQKKEVNVFMYKTDTMSNVFASLAKKESNWKEMVSQINAIRKNV
jgi:Helicase conserved C-terminal domain.